MMYAAAAVAAFVVPLITMDFSCPITLQSASGMISFPSDLSSVIGPVIVNDVGSFVCFSNETGGFQRTPNYAVGKPMIASVKTIAALKDHFRDRQQGLTFETWITPPLTPPNFDYLPILTIGRHDDSGGRTIGTATACHDHDFQLSQFSQYLRLSYTSSAAAGKCETAIFASSSLTAGELSHVVVSFEAGSTRVYIQGEAVSTAGIHDFLDPQLSNWNETYGLQMFSDHIPRSFDIPNASDLVFAGAIHTIRLYDYGLSLDDVSVSFDAGLKQQLFALPAEENTEMANSTVSNSTTPTTDTNLTATLDDQPDGNNEGVPSNGGKPTELVVPVSIFLTGQETSLGLFEYIINGISLNTEEDNGGVVGNHVRVDLDIIGHSGTLQLSGEHLELAVDFGKCSIRPYSDWKCRGNGKGRSLTFIAKAADVKLILTNLTYTPFFDNNNEDQLVVSVYEGEGGECLDSEEHMLLSNASQGTGNPRCVLLQGTILIPKPSDTPSLVEGDENDKLESEKNWFENTKEWLANDFVSFFKEYAFYVATACGSVMILLLVWYWHHKNRGKKEGCVLGKALDREQGKIVSVTSISSDNLCSSQAGREKQDKKDTDEEVGFGEAFHLEQTANRL
jgi:hypothetical protein